MLLFIHVPKTAGSSFRAALMKCCGEERVALDYGRDSPVTSNIVKRIIYGENRFRPKRRLMRALHNRQYEALAGHFPYATYGKFFAPERVVCFIREPLLRAASEYLHDQRNKGYEGSFGDFIELRRNQNTQSGYLSGLPEGAFVGITEHYRESIGILSRRLRMPLRVARRNTAPRGGAKKFVRSIPPELSSRFYELNAEDSKLYRHYLSVFDSRRTSVTGAAT
jgi:hypothetical protein